MHKITLLVLDKLKIKLIINDTAFRLLFLNMVFVILGYAAAYMIGNWFVPFFRIFKLVFVLFSLLFILNTKDISTKFLLNSTSIYSVLGVVIVLSLFSKTPFISLYKGLTFVFPFLYILFTINYLLKYGAYNLLISLSLIILITYAIVPFSYYILGGSLTETIVYGYNEGEYFVSNHYGWGCTLYLLSAFTILRFYDLSFFYKIILYISLPLAFYLLIISANRAGILSLLIAFLFFLWRDKKVNFLLKLLIIIIPIIAVFILFKQGNSAIDFIIAKNESQISTGQEGRFTTTLVMIEQFSNTPVKWFTGVGMFNYDILKAGGAVLPKYHNSYWEVLFGSGIIVFLLFIGFMVYRPFVTFFKISVTYSLLFIPLLLIPFFESNLTAGQFLFFPWFAYMILLNAKEFYIDTKLNEDL